MIDFTYAKNKTYDLGGEQLTVVPSSGSNSVFTVSSDGLTYLELLDEFLAWTGGGVLVVSMDTEYINITHNYVTISTITCNEELAYILGLNASSITGIGQQSYNFPTWGYKLPRTNIHELASLSGGFVLEKVVKDMYRQRLTKVTKNMTFSAPYAVRRGLTYSYRLDQRHIEQFDKILAEWMDLVIAHTTDFGIMEGTCISDDSGIATLIYPTQDIYELTLTLLG